VAASCRERARRKVTFHLTAGVLHRTTTTFVVVLRRGSTLANLVVAANGSALSKEAMHRLAAAVAARMTRP